ncbi:hypothetical protein B4119_0968 [Parageobacillus caldoxylosilyticus]|uniref:Uncharacterized protein n=1 Tax=Saccharococcus caldoxylosilyticus TaxID=81408 RepID=A0A150LM55_9BACL|nr:hypothetical protein B4119_0968 [Parageobacillus caldoxylosilyticus]
MSLLVVFCGKLSKNTIRILHDSLIFVKLENNKNNKKIFAILYDESLPPLFHEGAGVSYHLH